MPRRIIVGATRGSPCFRPSLRLPPTLDRLGVARPGGRRANQEQLRAVRTGFEIPGRLRRHPHRVPRLELDHLVLELEPRAAREQHVDLFLPFVRVTERHAEVGRHPQEAERRPLGVERPGGNAVLQVGRHAVFPRRVLHVPSEIASREISHVTSSLRTLNGLYPVLRTRAYRFLTCCRYTSSLMSALP